VTLRHAGLIAAPLITPVLSTQDIDPNAPKRRFFLLRWIISAWHWLLPPTQAHADRETGQSRLIRASAVIGVCLAVIVVAIMYARPMKDSYDQWKAAGLVQDAKRFADNGDIVTAVMTAQKVASIAPDYEPGIRMNAQLLTSIGYKEANYFWEKLEKQGSFSKTDQEGKVRALLRSSREKEARQQLERLITDYPSDAEVLKLAQEVWGKQQTSGIVMKVLKDYVIKHPEDKDAALRLSRFKLQSGVTEDVKSARMALWQLISDNETTGRDALRALAEMTDLDVEERRHLAERLDTHPLSDGWDQMKALTLRLSLEPGKRDQFIDAAALKFDGKRGNELVPFIRWLVENQEFGRVLNRLDVATIKQRKEDQPLLLNYLNALSMLGRIAELDNLVNDKEIVLQESMRALYRVLLAVIKHVRKIELIDNEKMARLLNTARVTALNDGQPELLFTIAGFCTDKLHSFYDIAEQCYQDLSTTLATMRTERRAFEGWMKCSRLAGHTETLHKASSRATERWPDDMAFLETTLYINLLRGDTLETTLERAGRLLDANPADSMRKIVCAFGYYRLGDLDSAVRVLQNSNLDSLAVKEGPSIIFATILAKAGPDRVAGGDVTVFRQQLSSVIDPIKDTAPLLPEERRMLIALRELRDGAE